MTLTLKSVGLISSGVLLIIISIALMDIQLFSMGLILLTFVVTTKLMRVKVEVTRILDSERILEGERVKVRVRVSNRSRREAMIILFDELPDRARLVEGINRQALVLESGSTTTMSYTIECPLRGLYSVGPLRVRRRDFFNLYFEEETHEEREYFSVYPRYAQIEALPVKSFQSAIFEMMPLAQAGLGYEFFCIRDYIKGDPLKRINWKIYARTRELMVNEYEKENLNDAMIILDAREVTKAGSTMNNSLELSIKMAASVASLLLKGRNQVGLLTFGGKDNSFILPPAPGKNQLDELLTVLVSLKAQGKEPFKTALDKAKHYLTPRMTIVLISPLDKDGTVVDAAKEIVQHYRFIILSPNSFDIEKEVAGVFSSKHLLLELEKNTLLEELHGFGVTTVPLTQEQVSGETPISMGVR